MGLVSAGLLLPAVWLLVDGDLESGGFHVPNLEHGAVATYRWAEYNQTRQFVIGDGPVTRLDVWGQPTSCELITIRRTPDHGIPDFHYCLDRTGSPEALEVSFPGVRATGQSMPRWGTHGEALELVHLLLQGLVLREGHDLSFNFSGSHLRAHVIQATRHNAIIDLVLDAHKLVVNSSGNRAWVPVQWVTRLHFEKGLPVPTRVRELGEEKELVAELDLEKVTPGRGKLEPFQLEAAPQECGSCRWQEFGKLPPLEGPFAWSFAEAVVNASTDSKIASFLERPSAVVLQANYSMATELEPIAGPLVRPVPVASWGMVVVDGVAGEKLSFVVSRRNATPTSSERVVTHDLQRADVDFRFPPESWPKRLFVPTDALTRGARDSQGKGPVFFEYNPGLDGEYFSRKPRAYTLDPDTQRGIHPMFFHVRMDFSSGSYRYSLVNGQWLHVPGV